MNQDVSVLVLLCCGCCVVVLLFLSMNCFLDYMSKSYIYIYFFFFSFFFLPWILVSSLFLLFNKIFIYLLQNTTGHEFHVPKNMLATRIKISVVYKGVFTARGYILGRLAVGLYRVPEPIAEGGDEEGAGGGSGEGEGGVGGSAVPPIPVGYSPASLCELNTPDGMGRIAIIHEPSAQYLPVRAGRYRIVVAAASKTGYSFTVMCTVGHHVRERLIYFFLLFFQLSLVHEMNKNFFFVFP